MSPTMFKNRNNKTTINHIAQNTFSNKNEKSSELFQISDYA